MGSCCCLGSSESDLEAPAAVQEQRRAEDERLEGPDTRPQELEWLRLPSSRTHTQSEQEAVGPEEGSWMVVSRASERSADSSDAIEANRDGVCPSTVRDSGLWRLKTSESDRDVGNADLFSDPGRASVRDEEQESEEIFTPHVVDSAPPKETERRDVGLARLTEEAKRHTSNSTVWSASCKQQDDGSGKGETMEVSCVQMAKAPSLLPPSLPPGSHGDSESVHSERGTKEEEEEEDEEKKREKKVVTGAVDVLPMAAIDSEMLRDTSEKDAGSYTTHSEHYHHQQQQQQESLLIAAVMEKENVNFTENEKVQNDAQPVIINHNDQVSCESSSKDGKNALADIVRRSVEKEPYQAGPKTTLLLDCSDKLKEPKNVLEFDAVFAGAVDVKDGDGLENKSLSGDTTTSTGEDDGVMTSREVPNESVVCKDGENEGNDTDTNDGVGETARDEDKGRQREPREGSAAADKPQSQEYIDSGSSDGGSERRRLLAIVQPRAGDDRREQVEKRNDEANSGCLGEAPSSAATDISAPSVRPRPLPIISPPPVTPQNKDFSPTEHGDLR